MSPAERALDVRGLPPCEPMERILEEIETIGPDDRLRVTLTREPVPLFPILVERGYAWNVESRTEELCEVLIWRGGSHTGPAEGS